MITIREEQLREGFNKIHLENLGFDAVIHQLSTDDEDIPHDHPFSFQSFILQGSYIERRWFYDSDYKTWLYNDYERNKGDSFIVYDHTIHQIIKLPEGKSTSLILPQEKVREWSFYKFENGIGYRQQHNKQEWESISF